MVQLLHLFFAEEFTLLRTNTYLIKAFHIYFLAGEMVLTDHRSSLSNCAAEPVVFSRASS